MNTHKEWKRAFAATQATQVLHWLIATTDFQTLSSVALILQIGAFCQYFREPYNNWTHIITKLARKPIKCLWFFAPKIDLFLYKVKYKCLYEDYLCNLLPKGSGDRILRHNDYKPHNVLISMVFLLSKRNKMRMVRNLQVLFRPIL